jgi:signal peptidase II
LKVLIISFIVVIVDQVSKLLVKGFNVPFLNFTWDGMEYGQSINILGDLLKFTYVENPGMAFGIHIDGYAKLFLSLFSLIASIGILIYIHKSREQKLLFKVALALILGGAVGNLIDRFFYGVLFDYAPLLYGRVVDFLHFDALGFTIFGKTFDSFPIFNVADSAVTIGVGILIIFHRSFDRHEEKLRQAKNNENEVVLAEDNDATDNREGSKVNSN